MPNAKCHLPFGLCHLAFGLCHSTFAIWPLPFDLCHLAFGIGHLAFVVALPIGRASSRLACGRGMTCTETSSPTRRAAAAPASVAAFTAATSPRTIAVT